MRKIYFIVLFLLGIVLSLVLLAGSTAQKTRAQETQETQETLRTFPNPADLRGWEIYSADQPPPDEYSNQFTSLEAPSDLASLAVASPQTTIPIFTVTLIRRYTVNRNTGDREPIQILFYDAGTRPNDGDAVRITFNGRVIREVLPLSPSAVAVPIPGTDLRPDESDFRPGINRLEVTALGTGRVPLNTVGIIFPANIVGDGRRRDIPFGLASSQTIAATLGFPQIALCKTRFRFPCRPSGGLSVFPESAQHVLEAQGVPPEPITVPLKPGRSGNPLRTAGYPRLLTVDRPRRDRRSYQSVDANYLSCSVVQPNQNKDEYPPAVFLENGTEDLSIPLDTRPIYKEDSRLARYIGSAHVKCISDRDNQQSGNSFGQQLRLYIEPDPLTGEAGRTRYRIANGNTIEFVILD